MKTLILEVLDNIFINRFLLLAFVKYIFIIDLQPLYSELYF